MVHQKDGELGETGHNSPSKKRSMGWAEKKNWGKEKKREGPLLVPRFWGGPMLRGTPEKD